MARRHIYRDCTSFEVVRIRRLQGRGEDSARVLQMNPNHPRTGGEGWRFLPVGVARHMQYLADKTGPEASIRSDPRAALRNAGCSGPGNTSRPRSELSSTRNLVKGHDRPGHLQTRWSECPGDGRSMSSRVSRRESRRPSVDLQGRPDTADLSIAAAYG